MQQGSTQIRRPSGSVRTVVAARRAFVARTFSSGEVRAYRAVVYRGIPLAIYAPFGYYPLGYYGYALSPWDGPIEYPWAWAGDPWYGYYGRYYRPWGVYPRPSYWLTDYMIARTLQNAYDTEAEARGQQDAADAVDSSAPMSDEVKGLIEVEVRRQLAEAQAEARAEERGSSVPADALPASFNDPGSHLFLASDSLEVQDASTGESCVLGGGDAIQMKGGLPRSGEVVNVTVLASAGPDCAANTTVSVPIADLVEMHNHMRENLELGMEEMRSHQGMDSLPMLPAAAAGEPKIRAFAASFQPDPEVNIALQETLGQADEIEKEVLAEVASTTTTDQQPDPPGGVVDTRESSLLSSLQTGQSESQVLAIMGQPLRSSFLGGVKKRYEYSSGTVTFTDGELSEVEPSRAGGFVPQQQSAPPPPSINRPAAPPAPPRRGDARSGPAISVGMTESEVVAALGPPLRVSFLGGLHKMYEYRDRKITFTDGSVSEVQ